jgi:hypothetical protein
VDNFWNRTAAYQVNTQEIRACALDGENGQLPSSRQLRGKCITWYRQAGVRRRPDTQDRAASELAHRSSALQQAIEHLQPWAVEKHFGFC